MNIQNLGYASGGTEGATIERTYDLWGRGIESVKILGNFLFFIYLFIFGWAGSLLLRASFLQLRKVVAHSPAVVCALLIAVASFVEEHML